MMEGVPYGGNLQQSIIESSTICNIQENLIIINVFIILPQNLRNIKNHRLYVQRDQF